MGRAAKAEHCSSQSWKHIPPEIVAKRWWEPSIWSTPGVSNSLEDFLGRLKTLPQCGQSSEGTREQPTVFRTVRHGAWTFMPCPLIYIWLWGFPFSSFGWSLNLWRNAALLFMDFILLFYRQASPSEKQALASFLWVSRSVLNKGHNESEILTWDTGCFTLIKVILFIPLKTRCQPQPERQPKDDSGILVATNRTASLPKQGVCG